MAGLTTARILSDQGHAVVVVDKAPGPGGRMSTRRGGACRFDHGAQYFTVRDKRFADWVDAWRQHGLVVPWNGRIVVLDLEGKLVKVLSWYDNEWGFSCRMLDTTIALLNA